MINPLCSFRRIPREGLQTCAEYRQDSLPTIPPRAAACQKGGPKPNLCGEEAIFGENPGGFMEAEAGSLAGEGVRFRRFFLQQS